MNEAAYHISAGIDYNAGRTGIYEFVIFDATTEAVIYRKSYFKSKKSAVNAAIKYIQSLE